MTFFNIQQFPFTHRSNYCFIFGLNLSSLFQNWRRWTNVDYTIRSWNIFIWRDCLWTHWTDVNMKHIYLKGLPVSNWTGVNLSSLFQIQDLKKRRVDYLVQEIYVNIKRCSPPKMYTVALPLLKRLNIFVGHLHLSFICQLYFTKWRNENCSYVSG